MGLDMSYQAIPAAWGLIERARRDVALGEMLCLLPTWLRKGAGWRPGGWSEAEGLWREIRELARRHPGLEERSCDLGPWWDKLHFLLSPNRRDGTWPVADELLDRAVRGGAIVAEHARATQGSHIRYVTPAEVQGISELLGPVTIDRLRANYSPPDMEAACVYKFVAGREGSDWAALPGCFEALREFYLEVAGRDEYVIVCLD